MGVLDQLFGTTLPLAVRFLIAFAIVLGLIALTAWAVRRLAGRKLPLANAGRARQPRLGVLDAFAIDARRRLVLIRRDNVEHLIMIGGPNDLVVESNIVRTAAPAGVPQPRAPRQEMDAPQVQAPAPARAPAPPAGAAQPQAAQPQPPAPRVAPAPRPPVQPRAAALPPAPASPAPQAASEPQAPAPAPQQVPGRDAPAPAAGSRLPGFFRSTVNRASTPAAPPAPPAEPGTDAPTVTPPAPAERAAPAQAGNVDPLFADIERKLEQALHRTPPAPSAPPAPPATPPSRPAPPPLAARRPFPERTPAAPLPERNPAPAPAAAPVPAPAAAPAPAAEDHQAQAPVATKAHLDALEEEMANLLGRDRQP